MAPLAALGVVSHGESAPKGTRGRAACRWTRPGGEFALTLPAATAIGTAAGCRRADRRRHSANLACSAGHRIARAARRAGIRVGETGAPV